MRFNGQYLPNRAVLRRTAIIEATVGSNGLSIPMGLADNGMPVGIQLQTRPGGESGPRTPERVCGELLLVS